ncbi:alanine/glycine:cation symporter family protein [Peredibacter sp. HCB2-198]|uniref:alanine/glycine:cation symporter family protein n=1 Tax=Peredibacter sp. HCB2-198 TaxID=3383025 RepID=UPI0038B5EE40
MLNQIEIWTESLVSIVWGLPLVFSLCFSGLFFTVYFGLPQFKFFKDAVLIIMGKFDKHETKGEISHFQALCAALSATVGLGNIAGVAVAVSLGGPGAIFWLWVAGFLGMATKFTEVTLALNFREVGPTGKVHGGPMYTMKNGLKKLKPMGHVYAVFIVLSSFGIGNMFQSNQMASVLTTSLQIPTWISGLALAAMAGLILIGGIRRIANVTDKLVPFMIGIYILGALGILLYNYQHLPNMFALIFEGAFNGTAAVGGFAGAVFKDVVIMGMRRATFSNEAGMGSAAIAHSAAKSTAGEEGIVALLEPFIDTVVICSITGLVILSTGAWNQAGIAGSEMTAWAFESVYGVFGRGIVTLTVILFAFSTVVSWSYYGEQGVVFLFGEKYVPVYRYVFIFFIFVGAVIQLKIVMNISDTVNGLLAVPNLIATYLLLDVVKKSIVEFKKKKESLK